MRLPTLRGWVEGKALTTSYLPELDDRGQPTDFYTSHGGGGTNEERIENSFVQYVERIYKRNGIVWACIAARYRPFSEARFQMQELVDGRPGRLFDHPSLAILERPWPNATTGELLVRAEQDISLAGNSFWTPVGAPGRQRLRRLRPDWVKIVSGVVGDPASTNPDGLEMEPIAYIYEPPGLAPTLLTADRVAHYSLDPDPIAHWRGMSWLTPLVREIQADDHATRHKLKWFENGAALSTVISYDPAVTPTQFQQYVKLFNEEHRGPEKAYKTLHIGGGADATVVGSELKTDFRAIQGAGETRIAAAAGVGAVIARFSEGLAGSALNQGNYAAAKRQFGDMLIRPMWRTFAATFARFTDPPEGARLWYDARDVEFLKEDRKDAAEILKVEAETVTSLVAAGYTSDSAVVAVATGDLSRLEHTGLTSVQLQPPGGGDQTAAEAERIAVMLQKLYLAVGAEVITVDEARALVNRVGAGLAQGG